MLQQALLLHQNGRLAEAASLYRKMLALNPRHADALHLLGVIELQRRSLSTAIDFIDRAIEIDPNKAAYFCNRGVALQDLKRFDDALASFDRALAIRPDNPEVLNNRGTALQDLKRFDEALLSYDRALAIQPDYAEALLNRGNALRGLRRFDDALASYDHALAIEPNAMAYHNRGVVLHLLKRHGDAIASYEKAIALKPDYADAYNNLGHALAEQGKLDEAIARYERALAIKPDGVTYLNLGDALLEQGRRDDALLTAQAAALLDEGPSFPHFSLGVLLARCNRNDDARRHLLKYLEQDADDCQGARLILAWLGVDRMPERASESHLRRLYADRAGRWGGGGDTVYRGHELVSGAIRRLCTGAAGLDILDAGCGTGLVGVRLRDIARRLDGVDLTPAMLDRAKENGAYDGLYEGDLVEFLAAHPAGYDVVVSAATLIHFGDLKPAFRAAATSLRGNGLFVFTLFPNDEEKIGCEVAVAPLGGLGEGGCYVHGRGYVSRLAEETGFSVALMETDVHEYDQRGRPIQGLIVALRRDAAN